MRVIVYPEPGEVFGKPMRNDWHRPGVELKNQLTAAGYDVWGEDETKPNKEEDIALYFDALLRTSHPPMHEKSLYISLEPPVVNPWFYDRIQEWPYTRILTFSRRHCGGKVHWCPYPATTYPEPDISMPRTDKYVAIMSNNKSPHPGELYTARSAVIYALGIDLDLYGKGWEGMINHKGLCEHDYNTYVGYTKALSIENCYLKGYCSEKYWTPLQAGCEIQRIGWTPDYSLSDCDEVGWSELIVEHINKVRG